MINIVWNIPSEKDWDRLEELTEAMENFPDSALFKCWQHEAESIKKLHHIYE